MYNLVGGYLMQDGLFNRIFLTLANNRGSLNTQQADFLATGLGRLIPSDLRMSEEGLSDNQLVDLIDLTISFIVPHQNIKLTVHVPKIISFCIENIDQSVSKALAYCFEKFEKYLDKPFYNETNLSIRQVLLSKLLKVPDVPDNVFNFLVKKEMVKSEDLTVITTRYSLLDSNPNVFKLQKALKTWRTHKATKIGFVDLLTTHHGIDGSPPMPPGTPPIPPASSKV